MTRILHTYRSICDYATGFSTYTNPSVSVLSVGNLVITGGTLTEYVIDWYFNTIESGIQFSTGSAGAPGITYSHPFTGNQSIPVESGSWIPRIRYIVVDGIKVFPYHRPWENYCELPTITVEPFDCSNGDTGATYSHTITYDNTLQSYASASRTLRFYLNDDGSTDHLAVRFYGYQISDELKIYYCTALDPNGVLLEDIVVGSDITSYYTAPTRKHKPLTNLTPYKFVINLSDQSYTLGDYLKIEIIPSYVQPPNLNTNWSLSFNCIPGTGFTCIPASTDIQTIDVDTISMIWNESLCQYELSYNLNGVMSGYASTNAWTYMNYNLDGDTSYLNDTNTFLNNIGGNRLSKSSGASFAFVSSRNALCANNSGTTSFSKTGPQMVLSFSNENDYLLYKTDYNNTINSANWLNYSADPLSINHYKYWLLYFRDANSCGDAYVDYNNYLSYDAEFIFDDINFNITINLVLPDPVGYIEAPCENSLSTINARNTLVTNTYNSANFNRSTNVRYPSIGALCGVGASVISVNQTNVTGGYRIYLDAPVFDKINDYCSSSSPWCRVTSAPATVNAPQYWFWKFNTRTKIIPADTDDPTQNFEVWNRLNSSGCTVSLSNEVLIYKMLSGYTIPAYTGGTYFTGDMVLNVGKAWESLQDDNVEEPIAESSWWTKISSA